MASSSGLANIEDKRDATSLLDGSLRGKERTNTTFLLLVCTLKALNQLTLGAPVFIA